MTYTAPVNFAVGEKVTASKLNTQVAANVLHLFNRGQVSAVVASGALAITQTTTDVPGATVTFTMADAGNVLINATFDFAVTAATAGTQVGLINVDGGTNQSALADFGTGTGRVSAAGLLVLALTAGSHTVKLQAYKSVAGGTSSVTAGYGTALTVTRVI